MKTSRAVENMIVRAISSGSVEKKTFKISIFAGYFYCWPYINCPPISQNLISLNFLLEIRPVPFFTFFIH
jgi:hypothetical protein